jgi:hypothetical protein
LKEHGTQRQHTTTQTPEQSRVVERANRDIGEGIKAMLSQSGLPTHSGLRLLTHLSTHPIVSHLVHLVSPLPMNSFMGRSPLSPTCVSGDVWLMFMC